MNAEEGRGPMRVLRIRWLNMVTGSHHSGEIVSMARIAAGVVLVWAAALGLLVRPAGAENKAAAAVVLRVSRDGKEPFSSIQSAIDAAPQGALIDIAPGNYEEKLTISKPITLQGAGAANTIIRPKVIHASTDETEREAQRIVPEQISPTGHVIVREGTTEKSVLGWSLPTILITGTQAVDLRDLQITTVVGPQKRRLAGPTIVELHCTSSAK